MKLHFVKINPVENMTIFVLDQLPRKDHITISNRLMDYSNLHAEQVGFIESSKNHADLIRLQMMGGEFCGNATRSLAAFMVHSQHPEIEKIGSKFMVPLEVSGIDEIINCEVEPLEKTNLYMSKIKMPVPLSINEIIIDYSGNEVKTIRVDLPGITHFIVDRDKINDKDKYYEIIKSVMAKEDYDAFGIMYYDYNKNFMEPLVYVRSTESLFWERSCGSGSCALGCALAFLNKESLEKEIHQPGGLLKVSVGYENHNINSLYLNGEVEIVSEGIVYI
jgi:diaminopimelate epimerase